MKLWLKRSLWFTGALVLLLLIIVLIFSYWMDEPLRTWTENRLNRELKGYQVRLTDLDLNPFSLAIVLQGLTLIQEKHPDPPVAFFETIAAGVQWRALFSGRIVANVQLDRPRLHVNLPQLREVAESGVEVQDRGRPVTVESIIPIEINLLTVNGGELTYIDKHSQRPLQISDIALRASNIRNIDSPRNVYPSSFEIEATVFDTGKARAKGNADFLARPYPGFAADFQLESISLNYFAPILERHRVSLKSGRLDTSGYLEYAPGTRAARLKTVKLSGLRVDYIHTPAAVPAERKAVQKTLAAAGEVSNNPRFDLRIEHLQVRGDAGVINKATNPDYRVFVADAELSLENLSNHFRQGPAELTLSGDFMGSGRTAVTGTFRPEEQQGPDFDLNIEIEKTQLTALQNLLRAYGNFDVNAGTFALFLELQVRNESIEGYVKPVFKNIDVYDRRQDAEKNLFRKMYEGLVGGLSGLLTREPEGQMAGRVDISGPVENPRADTWQLVLTLVQNAFFKAILPGFEQELSELVSDGGNSEDNAQPSCVALLNGVF